MLLDLHRAAGLHVDLLGPVGGHVLGGAQQRAVGTVEHIGEAVAIEVHQDLARLAVDGRIFEHVLVDAVVVPLVNGVIWYAHTTSPVSTLRAKMVMDHLLSHLPLLHSSWVLTP